MKIASGLDVHKDSVFLCILHENGEKIQQKFGVLTEELELMRDLMLSEGVEECAMESTSIYWMPVWRVLERDFKLHLVNPYFIKQLPGRKSDVRDAEWIATCLIKGLISSSFVPEEKIQRLRQYNRRIFDLSASISRNLVKLDACVQLCKHVAHDIPRLVDIVEERHRQAIHRRVMRLEQYFQFTFCHRRGSITLDRRFR